MCQPSDPLWFRKRTGAGSFSPHALSTSSLVLFELCQRNYSDFFKPLSLLSLPFLASASLSVLCFWIFCPRTPTPPSLPTQSSTSCCGSLVDLFVPYEIAWALFLWSFPLTEDFISSTFKHEEWPCALFGPVKRGGSGMCPSRLSQHVTHRVLFFLCQEIREPLLCQPGTSGGENREKSHSCTTDDITRVRKQPLLLKGHLLQQHMHLILTDTKFDLRNHFFAEASSDLPRPGLLLFSRTPMPFPQSHQHSVIITISCVSPLDYEFCASRDMFDSFLNFSLSAICLIFDRYSISVWWKKVKGMSAERFSSLMPWWMVFGGWIPVKRVAMCMETWRCQKNPTPSWRLWTPTWD